MTTSGTWLSLERIQKRASTLAKARQLLMELKYSDDPRNPAERFQSAARWLAVQSIRDAERELHDAEKKAWKAGGASVSASTLSVFTAFNRIGPAKLDRLAVSKPASIVDRGV
jgi:hypothetical protein